MKAKQAKVVGGLVGGAIGLTIAFFAVVLMGAGHGTYRPFELFFAPIAFNIRLGLIGGIFLYALYGTVLGALSRGQRRRLGFAVIAVVHYVSFFIVFDTHDQGPDNFAKVMRAGPEWVYASGAMFVAANLTGLIVACIPPKVQANGLPPRCRQCGYDLTGNESGRCPECGLIIHTPPEVNLSAK
ncbi:MAG: hypothetical protein HZA51_16320 [Planctomycetes bacterium]|nr:hypothetical protein [Planctomycetota bacterium]